MLEKGDWWLVSGPPNYIGRSRPADMLEKGDWWLVSGPPNYIGRSRPADMLERVAHRQFVDSSTASVQCNFAHDDSTVAHLGGIFSSCGTDNGHLSLASFLAHHNRVSWHENGSIIARPVDQPVSIALSESSVIWLTGRARDASERVPFPLLRISLVGR